jgi:hypothetical protein
MTNDAIYGFVGVLLGSGTTAMLTVYREHVVSRREREAIRLQREQARKDRSDEFQRESLLAMQDAVSDVIKAVYNDQDRLLVEMQNTGKWSTRQWETPTATGWEDANLRLQTLRCHVFDQRIRDIARDIQDVARKTIWASSLNEAKQLNIRLTELSERFNEIVGSTLPRLYE